MSLCLCVTFSFSNRFSSFFYAVLLILHWPNMYFPPNNILHQISSSFYFSVFPLLPEQIFPFSKCFHSSNAFLSFTSQFSLPSLTKYLTSPFFFSFVDQILSFYLSSSSNIVHEAPLAPQELKKKNTNMLCDFMRMIFLFYKTISTCLEANSFL